MDWIRLIPRPLGNVDGESVVPLKTLAVGVTPDVPSGVPVPGDWPVTRHWSDAWFGQTTPSSVAVVFGYWMLT